MEEQTGEYYRQKYLKYKAKYLALQEQSGGLTTKSGIYYLFVDTTDKDISKIGQPIKSKLTKKEIKYFPSLKEIKKIFGKYILLNDKTFKSNDKIPIEIYDGKKIMNYSISGIMHNLVDIKCNLQKDDTNQENYLLLFNEQIKNKNLYFIYKLLTHPVSQNHKNYEKLKGINQINKIYKIRINRIGTNELLEESDFKSDEYIDQLFKDLGETKKEEPTDCTIPEPEDMTAEEQSRFLSHKNLDESIA